MDEKQFMENNDLKRKVDRILKRNSRYRREAYFLVSDAVVTTTTDMAEEQHIGALVSLFVAKIVELHPP